MQRVRFCMKDRFERDYYGGGDDPLREGEAEKLKEMFDAEWEPGSGEERLRNFPERFRFAPAGYNPTYEYRIALDLLLMADSNAGFEHLIRWTELMYLREPIHWTTAADALDLLGFVLPNTRVEGAVEWFHQQIQGIIPTLLRIARDLNPKGKAHVEKALKILEIRPAEDDKKAAFESVLGEPLYTEKVRKMAKHVLSGGSVSDFELGIAKLEDIEL